MSFGYEGGPPLALDDVSFTIERGQSVGIVGPTGAGKSTLVDVLLGLLPPTIGRVLIDGEPLDGRERAWQRQIGYVSQDVYLLDDSLRRNIAFGIPDGAIDEARLAAAVDAGAARRGRRGAAVEARHGGRRERRPPVGRTAPARRDCARALSRSAGAVLRRGDRGARQPDRARGHRGDRRSVHGTRTVIAIAHRLSTVKHCDQLIYLRDGKLAGIGTYQELMSDPGFRQLT